MTQLTNFRGDKNEISKNLFIDGIKIEQCVNTYILVWKKSINKNMNKIFKQISNFILKWENDFDIKVIYKDQVKVYHLKNYLKFKIN